MKTLTFSSKSLSNEQITIVVREFKAVEQKYGLITPATIVDRARRTDSPLHSYFEWNNTAAAEKYRQWQARHLIAKVFVSEQDEEDGPTVRAFVNIKAVIGDDEDEQEQGYVSMETTLKSKPMRQQVLAYAQQQLKGWRQRFGAYQEFYGVTKEIDKL